MLSRTSELRQLATELADRLAGTEHEQLAIDLRDAAVDLAGNVDLARSAIIALVLPALAQPPAAAPPQPSA